jgi:hypothetical protein
MGGVELLRTHMGLVGFVPLPDELALSILIDVCFASMSS